MQISIYSTMVKTEKISFRFFLFMSILCSVLYFPAYSQAIEIGGGIGASFYKGDITPVMQTRYARPAGQFILRYNPTGVVALRFSASLLNVTGSSKHLKTTDFYMSAFQDNKFTATILEGNLLLEYNFFNYREEKFRRWSPYFVGGIGLFNLNRNTSQVETQEKVRFLNPCIPFGLGAKYVLHRNWNLGAEIMARKTFTDFLDGVSDINPQTNWQRGNPFTNDWYFYTGFQVTYTIYTSPCPIDHVLER